MVPLKRKGPLVFIQLLICAIIYSRGYNVTWAGEDCSEPEYNALFTAGLPIVRLVHPE